MCAVLRSLLSYPLFPFDGVRPITVHEYQASAFLQHSLRQILAFGFECQTQTVIDKMDPSSVLLREPGCQFVITWVKRQTGQLYEENGQIPPFIGPKINLLSI